MLKEAFLKRMKDILNDEYEAFLKSYDDPSMRAIRINKEKISVSDFLKINPFKVEKINLRDDCFYLKTDEKIGRHPIHHSGMVYLQDPSAMLPAYAVDFDNGIRILDLCAAPGGKTGQLASLNNEGIVIANEINKARSKVLFSNIERLGYKNVIITSASPCDLKKKLTGFFDLILIDAPCSGEGMFRKDEGAVEEWSEELVNLNSKRQKEIIDDAVSMLKQDGLLIYSTCTFSPLENEDIIKYITDKYSFEILKPNDEVLKLTKSYTLEYGRRSYPHLYNGEGQFLCVLKKLSSEDADYRINKPKSNINKIVLDFFDKYLDNPKMNIRLYNNHYYHVPCDINLEGIDVVSYGVCLGEVIKDRFVPHHNLFTAFGRYFKNQVNLSIDDERLTKYLRGEEIDYPCADGFGVIMVENAPLGGFKAKSGVLKNYYPKGLRNF